jgi:predicted exporter
VDYAIYLFTQTAPGERAEDTLGRIWPILRLGAATSVVGFGAMLFSSFTGFAQLGLFSITGLVAAAGVTRFVLPYFVPRGFFAPSSGIFARPLLAVRARRGWLRALVALAVLGGGAALLGHKGPLWDGNLADLSPIPAADQAADQALRHDMGVPDERYFVVFKAASEAAALEESEALSATLQNIVAQGALGGFDLPSAILPSEKVQRQRQAAIPDDTALRARFAQALAGLPFRADAFAPFFPAAAQARTGPVLTGSRLPPAMALQLQSMLTKSDNGWIVIAPLRGVTDPSGVAAEIAAVRPGAQFVDLDHESAALLRIFQRDATRLAVIGSVAILAVLLIGLRSPVRVLAVAAPLAAAVIVTAALLTLGGAKLSIFMVVGFLLIVAVGSNYCLFLERRERDPGMRERSAASVVLANLCTVAAYGLMSFSRIPVLHDIGMTVAIGTFLSLYCGAALGHSGAA